MSAMKNAAIDRANHPRMDYRYRTACNFLAIKLYANAMAYRMSSSDYARRYTMHSIREIADALRSVRIAFRDWRLT